MDMGVPCQASDEISSNVTDQAPESRVENRRGPASKLGVLELARELGSVSRACKIVGYSRDSFYRFKRLYETGGEAALQGISRRKPILKNRVAPEIEAAVLKLAGEQPLWGQARVARELTQRGLSISAGGVRYVWLRNQLQTAPLRLKALEVSAAREVEPSAAE